MSEFPIHAIESAPSEARPALEKAEKAFGFVPNLIAIQAEAPPVAKAYLALDDLFSSTSFSAAEQQVVLLAASFENGCPYCMSAHSAMAKKAGVADDHLAALRAGKTLPDAKLEALRRFTADMTRTRAETPESALKEFLAAGWTRGQALEVVLGIAQKTLSNYTNHLAHTPVDEALQEHRWTKEDAAGAAG